MDKKNRQNENYYLNLFEVTFVGFLFFAHLKGHLHHAFIYITFDFLDFLDEHKQFQGIAVSGLSRDDWLLSVCVRS
jgi:hypothetical protein